jgi:Flp pilus assembly pilin Flp
MAEATLNDVSAKLSSQMRVDEAISRGVQGLRDDFQKLYGIQTKLLRELAEAKREGGGSGGGGGGGADPAKEAEKGINPFLAAAMVAAVAVVTAVKDYFQNVTKLLKTLSKPLRSAIAGLGRLFKAIFREAGITKVINNISTTVRGAFSRLGTALKTLLPDPEAVQDSFKALKGYFTRLRTFFTTGGDDFMKFLTENSIFRVLKNGFNSIKNLLFGSFEGDEIKLVKDFIGNIGKRISAFFEPIKNFFSFGENSTFGKIVARLKSVFSFAQEGSGFAKMLGTVGRVIGRLAWPITLIMSVIDAVTGAFKGFVNTEGTILDKVIGGIAGGISGLLEGLIGMPLDLLKSAVSWIAGKLGFEEAETFLDSFNFVDIIRDIVMSPIVMLKRAFNGILEIIASAVEAFDIPFVDEKEAANTIRGFKFDDTGESRTEMVARKKQEDIEAGEQLDAYDAEQGLSKKKYKTKKLAQAAAGPGETVVQDNTGAFRIKKKEATELKEGQAKGAAGKFVEGDLAPSGSGATPSVTVVNQDNSQNTGGSGTVLAGETRPSTGNDRALGTGFFRTASGY